MILADATHDPDKVGGTSSDHGFSNSRSSVWFRSFDRERRNARRSSATLIDAAKVSDREEHWRLGLCRPDPGRRAAGHCRGQAEATTSSQTAGTPRPARACSRWARSPPRSEGWGPTLVWENGGAAAIEGRGRAKAGMDPIAIPECLRRPAPVEARPPRPLAPSQIVEDRDAAPPPDAGTARRGATWHLAPFAVRATAAALTAGDRHALWRCDGSSGWVWSKAARRGDCRGGLLADRRSCIRGPVRPRLIGRGADRRHLGGRAGDCRDG